MSNFTKLMAQAAAGNAGGGDFYPYTIDNSVRFNEGDGPYLTRTFGTGDSKTWGMSLWIKFSYGAHGGVKQFLWTAGTSSSATTNMAIENGYAISTYDYHSSAIAFQLSLNRLLRDPSAWMHIYLRCDTTNATAGDRVRIYINGVEETSFSYDDQATLNQTMIMNSAVTHYIGRPGWTAGYNFDGYMAEVVFIDGTDYDVTSLGEDKNGVWVPKDPSGLTFGTNGFWLDFADSSALGNDVSGNNNDWTVTGLTSSDQMTDTPTNNFATLNPLYKGYGGYTAAPTTLSDGNLVSTSTSGVNNVAGNMAIAGKNYFEATYTTQGNGNPGIGIMNTSGQTVYLDGYYDAVYVLGTSVQAMTYNQGDTIGVATDVDGGTVKFYRNGTLGYTASVTLTDDDWFPWVYGALNDVSTVNFGQSSFAYTPPTGYETLSTANFPEPTIGPNSSTQSDEHFNTVLYTGTGSTNSVTGVGFQPDFVWLKGRSTAYNHQAYDAVRGATNYLLPNLTSAEGTDSNALSSFNSDGFTVNTEPGGNNSGTTFVAWNWKANGSGSSNTDGSITSTVSANTDAGFSIVTWTGNGSASQSIGHGLGVTPKVIITKSRNNVTNWGFFGPLLGTDNYMNLNLTNAVINASGYMPDPSSSVINTGTNVWTLLNTNAYTYVGYCFAEVEGFSSFGSYTGNNSNDGPFVYTGFRPAFIILKSIDTAYEWTVFDSKRSGYNVKNDYLYANYDFAEASGTSYFPLDILSNGFKLRSTASARNASGVDYLYIAFAKNPFKYSNAR